jgi:glucosamine--fructose-6-phosphate aminotransferase (isomerizing)
LEYRGYDSVGITTIADGKLHTKKDKGKIDEVHKRLDLDNLPGEVGVGHTRWATHGIPSLFNAHPHFDCTGNVAVVHNGVIDNFLELRRELKQNGHSFESETDTEVIPHLIEELLREGVDLEQAVTEVTRRIEGTYAIVAMHVGELNKIVCTRNGNPLVIGRRESASYVSSDIPAFLPMTKDMILLLDGEIAILKTDGVTIKKVESGERVERDTIEISWTADQAQKGGYPHFMLKEIHEQPDAIQSTLHIQDEMIQGSAEIIADAKRVFLLAMGTSGHAAMAGRHMLASISGVLSTFEIASDFQDTVYDAISDEACVVAITQSGETTDTISAVKYAKSHGARIVAVTNVVGSSITRIADHTVITQAGPEIGVAATKTFMVQLTALAKIALATARLRKAKDEDRLDKLNLALEQLPEVVSEVITRNEEVARRLAGIYYNKPSFLFLGRGISMATAFEGALKLKEIAYNHAEGYSAGESKHGPIALVEKGFPVIFVAPRDDTRSRLVGNIMEMKARGAEIVAVIERGDTEIAGLADHIFEIPTQVPSEFTVMPYVVPLQIFSYYMARKKGYDPDKPRNLAKSVTVL